MRPPPEEYHRRVRVRLPFADKYGAGRGARREVERELEDAFARPLLRVDIPPRGSRPRAPSRAAGRRTPAP